MQPEMRTRETGADGRLVVATLPDGRYRWTADFPDGERRIGEVDLAEAETVRVALAAEETGSLRVTVLRSDGRPAAGAAVRVLVLRPEDDPGEGSAQRWAKSSLHPVKGVTGEDGVLVVTGVPAGTVSVSAVPEGGDLGFFERGDSSERAEAISKPPDETPVTVTLKPVR
jgi:hypothetical protein